MALIDKASLLMVPSTYEAGKLYNVLPSGNRAPDSTGENSGYDQTRADFDFDRGSNASATRIGSDGLIKKYRENLFTESNNFSDSDWSPKAGTFTKGFEDPNGGNEAWSWLATNTDPYLYQAIGTSGVFTLSIYAKGVGSTIGKVLELRNGSTTQNFTLTSEWQRFELYAAAGGSNIGFEFGNPAVAGDVLYIYAAQWEKGLVATDYLDSTSVTGKAGVLVDLPRINYDVNGENASLLLEPSRQQLIQYSEYFNGWTYKDAISIETNTNETTSPEGLYNASKMIESATTGTHRVFEAVSGTNKMFSFYAKAGGRDWVNVLVDNGGYVFFNVATGEKGVQQSGSPTEIEDAGNGWYRCSVYNFHPTYVLIGVSASDNAQSYTGDGTSGVYLYGAQVEASSYSTSYIPTMGTSETRAADSCLGAGEASTFNSNNGVLFWEGSFDSTSTIAGAVALIGAGSNRVQLYNSGSNVVALITPNGSTSFTASTNGSVDITSNHKYALKWALNDFAFWVDGVEIATDTSGATFNNDALNELRFSDFGANYLYANVKELAVFNEALSDSELATLTTL